jgi:hypothetical protein
MCLVNRTYTQPLHVVRNSSTAPDQTPTVAYRIDDRLSLHSRTQDILQLSSPSVHMKVEEEVRTPVKTEASIERHECGFALLHAPGSHALSGERDQPCRKSFYMEEKALDT